MGCVTECHTLTQPWAVKLLRLHDLYDFQACSAVPNCPTAAWDSVTIAIIIVTAIILPCPTIFRKKSTVRHDGVFHDFAGSELSCQRANKYFNYRSKTCIISQDFYSCNGPNCRLRHTTRNRIIIAIWRNGGKAAGSDGSISEKHSFSANRGQSHISF